MRIKGYVAQLGDVTAGQDPPIRAAIREPDQPVVVGVPPVDDRRLAGVGAVEEEEVVTDQFHLVQGLVDGHRSGGMLLLPHDAPGKVLVQIGERRLPRRLLARIASEVRFNVHADRALQALRERAARQQGGATREG